MMKQPQNIVIKKITFKNYKSFEQEQVFEIKPITIVIGKNNSGKSALIQLPLMLETWLEDRNGLSNEARGIKFSKQMKELVFNGDKSRSLEITFVGSYGVEIIIKIQFVEDSHTFAYLEWKHENGDTIWKVEKEDTKYKITTIEPNSKPSIQYAASIDSFINGISPVKSILVNSFEDIYAPYSYVEETGEYEKGEEQKYSREVYLGELHQYYNYLYFTGLRHLFTHASFDFDEQKYTNRDAKGEFAAYYLYKDEALLEKVKNWYIHNMDGWGMGLDKNLNNPGFYLYLQDYTKANGAKIPITQTGQGITQVLPLVTVALDDKRRYSGTIIIEQPELHIHPAAHGNLVELFVDSAVERNNHYILETHSEVMLLRIRRLVAEGKLKPDQVAIYWVDSEEGEAGKRSFLKRIEIDEEGNLDDWPAGIFSEDYNELMHIRKARKK